MPSNQVRSIRTFCRRILPLLHAAADGRRMLASVRKIVETDRWNSFDRFHDTTRAVASLYEDARAKAEVHAVQTGGRIGTGRWIIHEAADVRAATVDIIEPVRRRLLDYRQNPWHVVQWSAATPPRGMTSELVVIDSEEEARSARPGKLAGKMVLTRMGSRDVWKVFADKGAAAVLVDRPVKNLPAATAWMKFGWGGIAIDQAAVRLVGLVISQNEGRKLRSLLEKRPPVRVRTKVDVRRYVGTHEVTSGIVLGGQDPQDEVWALAHSFEPGAADNASGVAACVEIARTLESLIRRRRLPRPRRSIRLLSGYECYGFFSYLENVRRLQPPLAGVCVDVVGSRPSVCGGRLEWHDTIPMSAGFVDWLGASILAASLRLDNPGYKVVRRPFVATLDTLLGDPKYGFPCPWLTTNYKGPGRSFDAYHSSADTADLLSPRGLALCAAAMAAYLYYLADAGSDELMELAAAETDRTVRRLQAAGKTMPAPHAEYLREQHHVSIDRLKRWMWGGDRTAILSHLSACEARVREAARHIAGSKRRPSRRRTAGDRRVPRRTAPLAPTLENTPPRIADRIRDSKLRSWALFWADGRRTFADIAEAIACERKEGASPAQVAAFFEAHAELGYVNLAGPQDMVTRSRLVADLKALGLKPGMDVMVHSSLSRLGHVVGGADTVIDALLAAVGRTGTVMVPSFNHTRARVYNAMATPCVNGAIPDAFWRRPEAVRSDHPSHAIAAIGRRAEALCRDHAASGIWSEESPIGRLVRSGGCILSLGVSQLYSTAYHVAEVSVPCGCIDQFGRTYRVVGPDGAVREVPGLAFRAQACPVSPTKLDEMLDRRRLQRHGTVGRAPSTLVKAFDLWRVYRERLKKVCPRCQVKPRYS